METVCQVENIRCYTEIRSNYKLVTRATHLLEVASKLTEEGLPDPAAYELLLGALDTLEAGVSPEVVELIFKCGLLKNHGIFPELAGCSDCGRKRTKEIHFNGGDISFLCDDCAKARGVRRPVSLEALNGLYKAAKADSVEKLCSNAGGKEHGGLGEALRLADEILSAFLQAGLGRAHNQEGR